VQDPRRAPENSKTQNSKERAETMSEKTKAPRGITRRLNKLCEQPEQTLTPKPHTPPAEDFAQTFLNTTNEAAKK
jgi:hypothetical protein